MQIFGGGATIESVARAFPRRFEVLLRSDPGTRDSTELAVAAVTKQVATKSCANHIHAERLTAGRVRTRSVGGSERRTRRSNGVAAARADAIQHSHCERCSGTQVLAGNELGAELETRRTRTNKEARCPGVSGEQHHRRREAVRGNPCDPVAELGGERDIEMRRVALERRVEPIVAGSSP